MCQDDRKLSKIGRLTVYLVGLIAPLPNRLREIPSFNSPEFIYDKLWLAFTWWDHCLFDGETQRKC
jgi:hypothetical protein